MYCKPRRIAVGFFLLLTACSRQHPSVPARIAVLRFENLSSDVSLDWMGRAASEIVLHEIGGLSSTALHANPLAQDRALGLPGESAERTAAIAEGATRLVIGQISRAGNRLLLDVTERDPATGKTVDSFVLAARDANDVYSLADGVARHLSPKITPFETRNNSAIAAWAHALEDTDYAKLTEDYSRAVRADPHFASAWLAWAASATGHGDRAAAGQILSDAQHHAANFNALDRARLKLATVELSGDRAAILAAMNEIGRLTPDDAVTVAAIADRNFAARQYPAAVAGYRRLTQLTPNAPLAWNQLGYALMFSGKYEEAISALQTYQHLLPGDANPLDSQGDVAFAFGHFSDAQKFYEQATAKNPAFSNSADAYKAAAALLMTGDVAGADKKFAVWVTARRAANDPTVDFRAAEWSFISGRHPQAFAALESLAAGSRPEFKAPQMKALLLTQMAIWDLQLGRRERALKESDEALKSGGSSGTTLIARFASEDLRTPAEWTARADRMLASPQLAQLKPVALAYALYFDKLWEAAAPLWKQMVDRSGSDDSLTPVIYGQVLVELKRPREAEPFVKLFPIPNPSSIREFASLAVPKIFDTRAAVLASEGKTAEADASRKVFKTLWPAP